MMREPAMSPRPEVIGYRLCKCERWNIARDDCGGDNGARSRCRLCNCSWSDLSRSSVCLGALSAPVAANKVVPRSPACQTELSLRDPGWWWGGCIRGLRAFMWVWRGCLFWAVASESGPLLTAGSEEKSYLWVTLVKQEPICHITCREWTSRTAFQQGLLVSYLLGHVCNLSVLL